MRKSRSHSQSPAQPSGFWADGLAAAARCQVDPRCPAILPLHLSGRWSAGTDSGDREQMLHRGDVLQCTGSARRWLSASVRDGRRFLRLPALGLGSCQVVLHSKLDGAGDQLEGDRLIERELRRSLALRPARSPARAGIPPARPSRPCPPIGGKVSSPARSSRRADDLDRRNLRVDDLPARPGRPPGGGLGPGNRDRCRVP